MAIKIIADFLQVFPGLALLGRVAQQVGRVKSRHHLDAFVILKTPAQLRDAFARVEKVFHRGIAEHDDHLRLDHCDFTQQKRFARLRLFDRWGSITWRATAIDVSDQHFFTFQTDRFDDLCQ